MSPRPKEKLRAFFAKYTEEPGAMVWWYAVLSVAYSGLAVAWFLTNVPYGFVWGYLLSWLG